MTEPVITSITVASSGAGHRPDLLTRKGNRDDQIRLALADGGAITVCPHGIILREGWPDLAHDLTGKALLDFAAKWIAYTKVRHSSLPAHCEDCA